MELNLFKKKEEYKVEENVLKEMTENDVKYAMEFETGEMKTFEYDDSKTIARNYRDYEIFNSLNKNMEEPYSKFMDVVNLARLKVKNCKDQAKAEKLQSMIINICSNSFMQDVSSEDLMHIIDYTMCGMEFKEKENPNLEDNKKINNIGAQAIKELYTRQLVKLDKKYGKALYGLSPIDYLKRKAEIDQDLSCVGDMAGFLSEYFRLTVPVRSTSFFSIRQTIMQA